MRQAVLLSGGIDGMVCAEQAYIAGDLVGCVFVDYGHPAQVKEGWKAFSYCGSREILLKAPHVRDLDLGDMATEAGARVVPFRNAILLSVAANAAHAMGADALIIGCNADDQRDYSDCRPEFLAAMSEALGLPIVAPLQSHNKIEIIAEARRLGFKASDAWSCYLGGSTPCGICPSCIRAHEAWTTEEVDRASCCGRTWREIEVNGHASDCPNRD